MISKELSQAIKLSRFPLAIIIILKHYYANDIVSNVNGGGFYNWLGQFSSDFFPAFAVPLFFFISGFLFFHNINIDYIGINWQTFKIYKEKIKKRIKSLLIPYLAWNLMVLVGLVLVQYFTNGKIQPLSKPLEEFNLLDVLRSMWAITDKGNPIDSPLWFIKDLMLLCLFSPVIMFFIKYTKLYGLIYAFSVYLFLGEIIHMVPTYTGQFFFLFGCYASVLKINKTNLLEYIYRLDYRYAFFAFSVILIVFLTKESGSVKYWYLSRFYSLISVLAVWPMIRFWITTNISWFNDDLSNSSFFIFACHKPLMFVISSLLFSVFSPQNSFVLCALIILIPALIYVICLLMYIFIKKYMPFLKFLNGYRL